MKITNDKYGRRLYKFSHGVSQGGYMFANKILTEKIENKEKLREILNVIVEKYQLIDVTIKIYDKIFFIFYMMKPSISQGLIIDSIKAEINTLGNFDEEYIFTSVHDLQEKYVREDLKKFKFDYDKG